MRVRTFLQIVAMGIILLMACKENKPFFNNPFDPLVNRPSTPANSLLIEDFDDGEMGNLLGYCHETFEDTFSLVGTRQPLASIVASYVDINQPANVLHGVGRSLQITYEISQSSSKGAAFGGYAELLVANDICKLDRGPFNLEGLKFDTLTFWIKAESPGINMEVALKDIYNNITEPKRLIRDYLKPDTVWKKAKIPIKNLVSAGNGKTVNLRQLREINFGFGKVRFQKDGGDLAGTIYLDEIAFER